MSEPLTRVEPYLFLEGRCEEAIEFYRAELGAKVTRLLRFKDSPDPHPPGMVPPGAENKVMHASFTIGETNIMASDGRCSGQPKINGVSLSLSVPDSATADRMFHSLAKGGVVQMPIGETFFSPRFGMVMDRFGVSWMVIAARA